MNDGMSDEPSPQKSTLARLLFSIAIGFCVGPLAVWWFIDSQFILAIALACWAVAVVIILRKWLTA
jgi:hypothetical protein